jgi:uncharacterized membrane protein YeiH
MPAFEFVAEAAQSERSIEGSIGDVRTVLLYAGTIAFAISAALLAGRRRMGMFAVVVFGVIVANGGGTTRDVLLGDFPVFWVDDPSTLIVAALAAAATIPLFRIGLIGAMQRFDLVRFFYTVGLALFTIIGTNAALDAGAGAISAVVVGMISGVGGGIIRDTIAERIPEVLASGHSYASAAAAGAALEVALLETSMSPAIASSIAGVAIITCGSCRSTWIGVSHGSRSIKTRTARAADDRRDGLRVLWGGSSMVFW